MAVISDRAQARRLARAIAADIRLYNGERVEQVTGGHQKLALLAAEVDEGRELFNGRVSPEIAASGLYDQVLAEAFEVDAEVPQETDEINLDDVEVEHRLPEDRFDPPPELVEPVPAPSAPPEPLRFTEPLPGSEPGEAYRQAEVRPLCVTCRELATAPCARCDKPFCRTHGPSRWQRCDACEGVYRRRGRTWGMTSGKSVLLLLGSIGAAVAALVLAAYRESLFFGVASLVLVTWSIVLPFKIDRLMFLLERRR